MGNCASADADGSGPSVEAEAAAAAADSLREVAADPQETVDRRVAEICQIFTRLMEQPRTKPPFDPANPQAHLQPAEPEEQPAEWEPPAPLMPAELDHYDSAGPEEPGEYTELASEEESEESEEEESEEEPVEEPVAAVAVGVQLMDVMELCGGREVWEDIQEMREDESASSILGNAGEHTSCYPWAKAHFLKLCFASQNLPNQQPAASPGQPELEQTEPCEAPPLDNYIAGLIQLRQAMSHIQRSNDRLRVNLVKDIARLHFDETSSRGDQKIGLELMGMGCKQAAEAKMSKMTGGGVVLMLERVEARIDAELLPGYYSAYEAAGDKEALAYPEEVLLMEQAYPPTEERSDDEAETQLDLVLHRAKDLIGADMSFAGEPTSDCYVKARVGDQTFISDVRKGTVNPLWEQRFKFEVDPEERKQMCLELQVYDDDLGSDEFLGMAKFKMSELLLNGPVLSKWLELTDLKGGTKQDRGQIFVSLRFGLPTVEGMPEATQDNVSCVALAQVEGYQLTRVQIQYCATRVQAVVRGWLARTGCGDAKATKSAEQMAVHKRVVLIQRRWREKRMWDKIKRFKKAMTAGGIFMKVSSDGSKRVKRQIHCPGNMSTIYWRDPEDSSDGNLGSEMKVSSVVGILTGRKTRTFQRYDQRLVEEGQTLDKEKCNVSFSLVSRERTLDLEAADESHKNDWIDLLQFLFRDSFSQGAFPLIGKRKKFN